jgi:hypothetical protein
MRGITMILLSIPMFVFYFLNLSMVSFLTTSFPQRGYVVIPFVPGYDDITGSVLKLDHIANHNLPPLDDFFRHP